MSFVFYTQSDFIRINPWFERTVEDRVNSFMYTGRFNDRVRNLQEESFKRMFDDCAVRSSSYNTMIHDATDRMTRVTDQNLERIRTAAETKVQELMQTEGELSKIRTTVHDTMAASIRLSISRIEDDARRAETARDESLKRMEKKISGLEFTNTILGICAFGMGLVFFSK